MSISLRKRPEHTAPEVDLGIIITPMLDMAFQLLAFFVMTYHQSALEGHIDGNLLPPAKVAVKDPAKPLEKDAPPPVQWPENGWEIKPDVIVNGPSYDVPAKGIVEWTWMAVPQTFLAASPTYDLATEAASAASSAPASSAQAA